MGSFFSSIANPSPLPSQDVHAFHSKDTWVKEWQTLKTTNKLVVGPCRSIEPVFKTLAEKFLDVIFVKIDVDELKDVVREWKVEAMPTFVFVKGGKEVDRQRHRLVGADNDELQKKITKLRE